MTFREIGVTRDAPIQRGTHEQIDFIVTPNRWKNSIKDVTGHHTANINSDHYPIVARINVRLKAIQNRNRARAKYGECDNAQKEHINKLLHEERRSNSNDGKLYMSILANIAKDNLPKLPSKERKTKFSKETEEILKKDAL